MKLLRKLKTFFSFDTKTMILLSEAFYFLGIARLQKKRPLSKIAPALGKWSDETANFSKVSNRLVLKRISYAIQTMSRYTIWESQCLVQAIAAKKMLERRGIENTLYLGTAKDEEGKLIAHAWLRSGSYYLTGAEEMKRFTVVSSFAKHMSVVKGGSDDSIF